MERTHERFLDALRCAVNDQPVDWSDAISAKDWSALLACSRLHFVLPLVAESVYACRSAIEYGFPPAAVNQAKLLVRSQAQHTADFLLLIANLSEYGLHPAVVKGIVCRSLYPHPEQRTSVDEDLLVDPSQMEAYHSALLEQGFVPVDPSADLQKDHEISYVSNRSKLYLEVHKSLFDPELAALSDMNAMFEGALSRLVTGRYQGAEYYTLAPTDHMLYLLCHAYKHLIYSGFGIRQVCDIVLYASRYGGEIDWKRVKDACCEHRIDRLAAAVFQIGEKYLDIPAPDAFQEKVDELPLLEDILTGGLYGVSDDNRLHSSTITLDAVAADREGRRSNGIWRSVFPTREYLAGRFLYLKKHPALLPVAWGQRLLEYLTNKDTKQPVKPSESIRIARERVVLLRKYGIID